MQEHPLTGLTALGIVAVLLGGLLLSPTPALSVSTVEPTRITLATPEPPKQIQPQPPVDDIAPPATAEPDSITRRLAEAPATAEPDSITRRLAEALGLKPEALTLVTMFQVTWPNSCLGCQQPGTECLQVLTPGEQRLYRVTDGREYDVRVGRNAQFLICAAPQQLTDSASAARSGAAEVAAPETAAPSDASVAGTPLAVEATQAVPDPSTPNAPTQAEQQLAAALTAPAAASAPVAVAASMEASVPVEAEVVEVSPSSRGRIMTVVGGLWLLLLAAVSVNVWYRRQRSRA